MISVIIPVYNVEKYITKCIDSVLAQTFKEFEIICINDGSKDNSGISCKEYAVKYPDIVKVIDHKSNKGLSAARNTGLKNAKYDYIYFLDSDDYIHPDLLKIAYNNITKYDADFVYFPYHEVSENQEIIHDNIDLDLASPIILEDPLKEFLDRNIKMVNSVWTKLFKKSSLQKASFYEGIYFEDVLFNAIYMANSKKGVYLPCKLHYYLVNYSSISRSAFSLKKAEDYIIIIKELEKYFAKHKYKEQIRTRVINGAARTIMRGISYSDNPKKFANVESELKNLYANKIFNLKKIPWKYKFKIIRDYR